VERSGLDRVPVVDEGGALRGLVCWNGRRSCFCADHPGDA
jgi:predicted phage tail protein